MAQLDCTTCTRNAGALRAKGGGVFSKSNMRDGLSHAESTGLRPSVMPSLRELARKKDKKKSFVRGRLEHYQCRKKLKVNSMWGGDSEEGKTGGIKAHLGGGGGSQGRK